MHLYLKDYLTQEGVNLHMALVKIYLDPKNTSDLKLFMVWT